MEKTFPIAIHLRFGAVHDIELDAWRKEHDPQDIDCIFFCFEDVIHVYVLRP